MADEELCPEDGTPMSVAGIDPYIGKTLANKYEVVELLGRGGMSVVYKVRQLFMNRLEALKLMRTELVYDSDALQRFQQESQAVAALRHVNIVTVLDFGVLEDGNPFLTMEFLEGKDLGDLIEKEQFLTPERAIPLFTQICAGLHHAHSRGVIHRDIKPSNILITTANGVDLPIIVDFGIAKLLHADGSTVNKLTTTGQVFGSPLYMSPEQCSSKRVDERTDVYALGCVFYHALTGKPPIQGNAPLETMMRQMTDTARPFSAVRPDHNVSPEIESVVLKSLAKNPEDRYANMNDLRQALLKAANMTITDLNSGSYIQSSGITPGIGTASGINNNRVTGQQTSQSQNLSTLSASLSSSTEMPLGETDTQQIAHSQKRKLFKSDVTGERYVVESSYQGLLKQPVVLIGFSLAVMLFLGLIAFSTFNPKHQPVTGDDSSVERTFGEDSSREKPNGRRGYASEEMAMGKNPDLVATSIAPGSPFPPGASASQQSFSSQPEYVESRTNRAKSRSTSSALSRTHHTEVNFNKGDLPSWHYDVNGTALSITPPSKTEGEGTIYHVSFGDSASNADFDAIARREVSELRKKIAISANPLTRRPGPLPIYIQEIKYPNEQLTSFVLYFPGTYQVQALQVVPGRKCKQATNEFIDKVLIPRFSGTATKRM